jgi:hypothetical protein
MTSVYPMKLASCLNCIKDHEKNPYFQDDKWHVATSGCPKCQKGIIPSYLKSNQVIRYIKAYEKKHNERKNNCIT